jgi:hypothetical protein
LKDNVEAEDQRIKDSISSGSKTKKSEKRKLDSHKASTVTSSKATCGGATAHKPAYSSLSRLPTKARGRYAKGTGGKRSNMCKKKKNGKPFKHSPDNFRSSCNHTEGRIIEDLFKKHGLNPTGCELVMKIKWKQRVPIKKGKKIIGFREKPPLDKPCPHCEKVICHAIACGLKIFLCKDNNGEQRKEEPDFCEK